MQENESCNDAPLQQQQQTTWEEMKEHHRPAEELTKIRKDTARRNTGDMRRRVFQLRDRSFVDGSGYRRPKFETTVPIVCESTREALFSVMKTNKQGYCVNCRAMRNSTGRQNRCGCGKKLTMQLVRDMPSLHRVQPLPRNLATFQQHAHLFLALGIVHAGADLDEHLTKALEKWDLVTIFVDSSDFDINKFLIAFGYSVGVFAGRKFKTGSLARKFLKDTCGFDRFRHDFPEWMEGPEHEAERLRAADMMNERLRDKAIFFMAHPPNIEAYFDWFTVGQAQIRQVFDEVCQEFMPPPPQPVMAKKLNANATEFAPSRRIEYFNDGLLTATDERADWWQ